MFRVVCGSDICKNIAEDYLNACVCGTENEIEANENTFFLLLAFHFYLSIFSFLLFWSMSSYSSHLNAYEKKLFIIVLSIRSFIFFLPQRQKKLLLHRHETTNAKRFENEFLTVIWKMKMFYVTKIEMFFLESASTRACCHCHLLRHISYHF